MILLRILTGVNFVCADDISRVQIKRVTTNSKAVKKGSLFIAVKGTIRDGHDFIGEAAARGAAAIVTGKQSRAGAAIEIAVKDTKGALPLIAANFYGHPSAALKSIGITGTNGKTTITYIVESILKAAGLGVGVIGTIEYRIGKRAAVSNNTTPGVLELQSILKDMADSRLDYAVMEASSHGLDQDRIAGIALDAAAFANITPEHLDYHKTIKNYLKAKSKIFKFLKKDGVAVLNADDALVSGLTASIKNRVLTYGIKTKASVMAKDISASISGSRFKIMAGDGGIEIRTALLGAHNVSNILAAFAITKSQGIDLRRIKDGIERLNSVPGRLEEVCPGAPFRVFVDYAHTDDALYNVLGLLRSAAKRRIITVFGCGGNRDSSKRPRMGRAACELSDRVVITSDNPRNEDPAGIIADILNGVEGKFSNFSIEEDRAKAIASAIRMAGKGDVILIAGKGHETHQIIGGRTIPFDDREIARSILG